MTALTFSLCLVVIAYIAGLLGAITGLGGGFILIPALVLLFDVDIHYAMGAAVVAILATSSGAASAYLKEGYTNLRIGMFLVTGAVIGAFFGAWLVTLLPAAVIAILFGAFLCFAAYVTLRRQEKIDASTASHPWATFLKLSSYYPGTQTLYPVQHVPAAFSLMTIAGAIAGLLGIGAGSLKVIAMDQLMGLPYKVSTATSNFMIGITATVSAAIYYVNGYIQAALIFPVILGVLLGSLTGSRILIKTQSQTLRLVFSLVLLLIGIQMLYSGWRSLA